MLFLIYTLLLCGMHLNPEVKDPGSSLKLEDVVARTDQVGRGPQPSWLLLMLHLHFINASFASPDDSVIMKLFNVRTQRICMQQRDFNARPASNWNLHLHIQHCRRASGACMPFPTRFDDATDCSDGSVDCRRAFDVYVHVYVYDAITIARSVVSTCATIQHNVCAGEPPPPTPRPPLIKIVPLTFSLRDCRCNGDDAVPCSSRSDPAKRPVQPFAHTAAQENVIVRRWIGREIFSRLSRPRRPWM